MRRIYFYIFFFTPLLPLSAAVAKLLVIIGRMCIVPVWRRVRPTFSCSSFSISDFLLGGFMPESFRKTARSKLKSVFMAVSFFLASTAAADTGADARGSIITDNFALVASGSEDALPGPLARDPEGSAYLGT